MLQEACNLFSDASVLRRLTFAAATLPKDTPGFWEIVTHFGFSSSSKASWEKVKTYLENLQYLDEDSLNTDHMLMKELMECEGFLGHPIGVVLISSNCVCKLCNGKLIIRKDRPSFPTIYTEFFGTVNGTHFRKHCNNNAKGCSFTQHYGFHTTDNGLIEYDKDCLDSPYFLSTNMTCFSTKLLTNLSAEILLGQMSYKQKCDIYNNIHKYDSAIKKTTDLHERNMEYR